MQYRIIKRRYERRESNPYKYIIQKKCWFWWVEIDYWFPEKTAKEELYKIINRNKRGRVKEKDVVIYTINTNEYA